MSARADLRRRFVPKTISFSLFYEVFLALQGRLPDIEDRLGHAQGTPGAAHLAGEGSLAGDKRGYKYPLGGIWKEKNKENNIF